MRKLTKPQQRELPKQLEDLVNRSKVIAKCSEDIDTKAHTQIKKALANLNKTVEIILANQKARNKVFLSNDQIDEIFKNLNIN